MEQWGLHMNHYMVNSCEYYAKVKMPRGSVILPRNDHLCGAANRLRHHPPPPSHTTPLTSRLGTFDDLWRQALVDLFSRT